MAFHKLEMKHFLESTLWLFPVSFSKILRPILQILILALSWLIRNGQLIKALPLKSSCTKVTQITALNYLVGWLEHQRATVVSSAATNSSHTHTQTGAVVTKTVNCTTALFQDVQFSSVVHSYPTLCNSMDCSTPGLPVLSITNPQRLLKLKSIKWVMSSNDLILCCPLLFLPSIFSNISVFSSE